MHLIVNLEISQRYRKADRSQVAWSVSRPSQNTKEREKERETDRRTERDSQTKT